jgi:hypothetical protein
MGIPLSVDARTIEIPYRWADVEGTVRATVATNEDPEALGCDECARGFPHCRATIEPPVRGYGDTLGWVQLVERSDLEGGFRIDPFAPLGEVSHPFCFFGFAPVFFDAPHTDELENWDFLAHAFLVGLGGELSEYRREACALLGFSWGFAKRDQRVEWFGPEPLSARDWDGHRARLKEERSAWSFRSGFSRHALEP